MTVVAEVVRNGFVESVHHGHVVAVDGHTGRILLTVGDAHAPVLPRSSLKPLQALGMLRAGWSPADDEQVALACASHSGERAHLDVVRRILAAAGLDQSALDNTPGLPLSDDAAREVIRSGGGPDRLTQNCSGKHAGMLAACVANDWPVAGYLEPTHPVQRAITAAVEDLAHEPVAATTVDGCGAPALALSMAAMAAAFTRLDGPVHDAMRRHPFLVGGTGRDVTTLMDALPGFVAKDGAEGVYAAATRDGVGIVVKIEDGGGRARTPVLLAAMRTLGYDVTAVEDLATTPVLGHGEPVGEVRAVLPSP